MEKLIRASRSVIVSADVSSFTALEQLVFSVKGIPNIGGFKIGFTLAFKNLELAVSIIRKYYEAETVIIYDHQKAGTDIPEMAKSFAAELKFAKVDAAILFPFAGPETQQKWTEACFEAGLQVIIGGVMTHEKFLISENGYIFDSVPKQIFRLACDMKVSNFVLPATKLDWVAKMKNLLMNRIGEENFDLFVTGFVSQGGSLYKVKSLLDNLNWHAIVGSAIYRAENMRETAVKIVEKVLT